MKQNLTLSSEIKGWRRGAQISPDLFWWKNVRTCGKINLWCWSLERYTMTLYITEEKLLLKLVPPTDKLGWIVFCKFKLLRELLYQEIFKINRSISLIREIIGEILSLEM